MRKPPASKPGLALLIGWLAVRDREPHHATRSALSLYTRADGCVQIHKRFGLKLVARFNLTEVLGLRAADVGELTGTIEDWGKMLVMSFGCAYVFSEAMQRCRPTALSG